MPGPISPPPPPAAPLPPDSDRRVLIAAGVARYPHLGEEAQLPSVGSDLSMMIELFEKELSYDIALPSLRDDPSSTQLRTDLETWFTDTARNAGDVVVVYYSGHGMSTDDGEHYLVTSDCDGKRLTSTAMATSDFGRFLRQSPIQQLLLLIDTCDSGQGAHNFLSLASSIIGAKSPDVKKRAGIYAIAACLPRQLAEQSAFANAFRETVIEALRSSFAGGETQRFLYVSSLIGKINERLSHLSQRAQMSSTSVLDEPGFIRNPRFRENVPPGLDLHARKHADLTAHWGPRSRGLDVEQQHGFFFTGRHAVMSALVDWVARTDDHSSIIVTGRPGCGKSAVLARLVTLSDPEYRARVEPSLDPGDPVPELHSVFSAVRCTGKRVTEIAREIATDFGHPDLEKPETLLQTIAADATPRVIVFDALDEAADPDGVARALLVPLSELAGIRLLVGTREEGVDPLGAGFKVLDLDHPENLGETDVADYARKILLSVTADGAPSPYIEHPQLAGELAKNIAERASAIFLVARIVACSLLEERELVTDFAARDFPIEVGAAFGEYLARFGEDTALIRDVLLALAFAQGSGLPWETIWPDVIRAITRRRVTTEEMELALDRAGAFIIEDNEAGRSVYRLFHEALADYLREPYKNHLARIHRAIAEALVESVAREGEVRAWPLAHPYLRRHLIRHAALGAYLDTLLRDPWFVVHARPEEILRVLPPSAGQDPAGIYRSVVHRMRENDPFESLSYLEMAAQQAGAPDVFDWTRTPATPRRWKPLWASWRPDPIAQRLISGHSDTVTAIAAMTRGRQTIVASGSWDGTVLLWDAETGLPIGEPLAHPCAVRAVTFTRLRDRDALITAPYGGAIRMWFLDDFSSVVLAQHEFTTAMVALPFRGKPALAFGTILGEIYVIDLTTRKTVATTVLEPAAVYALTVHLSKHEKPLLAIGGHAGSIWSWRPEKDSAPSPFPEVSGPEAWVAGAVAVTIDGQSLMVTDGLQHIVLWDPVKQVRIAEIPMRGVMAGTGVPFVTAATNEDGTFLVAGDGGGALHLFDLGQRRHVRILSHDRDARVAQLVATRDGMTLIGGKDQGVLRVRQLGHDLTTQADPRIDVTDFVLQTAIAGDESASFVAFLRYEKATICDASSGTVILSDDPLAARTVDLASGTFHGEASFAILDTSGRVTRIEARTGRTRQEGRVVSASSIAFMNIRGSDAIVVATSNAVVRTNTGVSLLTLPSSSHINLFLSRDPEVPVAWYRSEENGQLGRRIVQLEGEWTRFVPNELAHECLGVLKIESRPFALLNDGAYVWAQAVVPQSSDAPWKRVSLPASATGVHAFVANGTPYLVYRSPSSRVVIVPMVAGGTACSIDLGVDITTIDISKTGLLAIGTRRGLQMLRVML
jgi:WD40 repeat protein